MRQGTNELRRVIVGVALAIAFVASTAEARPRPRFHRRSNFEANKTFGLGLMLGAPTGLTGKYFVGRSTAIDFGLGTIYDYRDRRGFHIHGDFLWHPVSLASTRAFELPFYIGVGARFLDGERCYVYRPDGRCDYYYHSYSAFGVRVPLGLSLDFNNVPLDVFFEVVPVLDFLTSRDPVYDSAVYFDVDGAIGVRYYFD
jgi:hypothetical protein